MLIGTVALNMIDSILAGATKCIMKTLATEQEKGYSRNVSLDATVMTCFPEKLRPIGIGAIHPHNIGVRLSPLAKDDWVQLSLLAKDTWVRSVVRGLAPLVWDNLVAVIEDFANEILVSLKEIANNDFNYLSDLRQTLPEHSHIRITKAIKQGHVAYLIQNTEGLTELYFHGLPIDVSRCVDTLEWTNGFKNGPNRHNCNYYATNYCDGTGAKLKYKFLFGKVWNYPERNCCACGKGKKALDEVQQEIFSLASTQGTLKWGNKEGVLAKKRQDWYLDKLKRFARDKIDHDNSHTLSKDEFHRALKSKNIHMPDQVLDVILDIMDKDGDGDITWGDFADSLTSDKLVSQLIRHYGWTVDGMLIVDAELDDEEVATLVDRYRYSERRDLDLNNVDLDL